MKLGGGVEKKISDFSFKKNTHLSYSLLTSFTPYPLLQAGKR